MVDKVLVTFHDSGIDLLGQSVLTIEHWENVVKLFEYKCNKENKICIYSDEDFEYCFGSFMSCFTIQNINEVESVVLDEYLVKGVYPYTFETYSCDDFITYKDIPLYNGGSEEDTAAFFVEVFGL